MAIKAHLNTIAAGSDQRAAPRRTLYLETSGVMPGGLEANVTVHNLSAAGLLIETIIPLSTGEGFTIDLPEAGPVAARVVWDSGDLYGCAFEQAIGAATMAAASLQGAGSGLSGSGLGAATGRPASDQLGVRLNRLRRERGLTLADVATVLGVSKPTVWAWEKGKARPLPERIVAIAEALGVTPGDLRESASEGGAVDLVIEQCRQRIAAACGADPSAVRIMVEL